MTRPLQEYLRPLVDSIHYFCAKKTVSCKSLVILTLKAVNKARSCLHYSVEDSFRPKVFPGQPHKVFCTVAELLGRGDHADLLVQDLKRFFLGELVLTHGVQDLQSPGAILRVLCDC